MVLSDPSISDPFQTLTHGTPPVSLPPGRPRWSGLRRRWWMFRIFDLIARSWPAFGPRHGLLVVRIDGLGDMLLFRPTLDHYAEIFGVSRQDITVLGVDNWKGLAASCFDGYRLKFIDARAFETNLFYRFKTGLWLKRQRFAIAVCDSFFRKAMIADSVVWFSAAPRKIHSQPWISRKTQAEYAYYQRDAEPAIDVGAYPTHEILRHARFVSTLAGRSIPPTRFRLDWPRGRAPIPPGPGYVVLNFGCNEPGRRWPFENYRLLAHALLRQGYRVVLTGTKTEGGDLEGQTALLAEPNLINLVGKTNIDGLCDVFADAKLVVCNDTGPGHLSITLDVPTVMVIGGGHFGNFVPYPEGLRPGQVRFVFEPMPCYHCFWNCTQRQGGDDRTSFPCLQAVSVDRVWAEVSDLLGIDASVPIAKFVRSNFA